MSNHTRFSPPLGLTQQVKHFSRCFSPNILSAYESRSQLSYDVSAHSLSPQWVQRSRAKKRPLFVPVCCSVLEKPTALHIDLCHQELTEHHCTYSKPPQSRICNTQQHRRVTQFLVMLLIMRGLCAASASASALQLLLLLQCMIQVCACVRWWHLIKQQAKSPLSFPSELAQAVSALASEQGHGSAAVVAAGASQRSGHKGLPSPCNAINTVQEMQGRECSARHAVQGMHCKGGVRGMQCRRASVRNALQGMQCKECSVRTAVQGMHSKGGVRGMHCTECSPRNVVLGVQCKRCSARDAVHRM